MIKMATNPPNVEKFEKIPLLKTIEKPTEKSDDYKTIEKPPAKKPNIIKINTCDNCDKPIRCFGVKKYCDTCAKLQTTRQCLKCKESFREQLYKENSLCFYCKNPDFYKAKSL